MILTGSVNTRSGKPAFKGTFLLLSHQKQLYKTNFGACVSGTAPSAEGFSWRTFSADSKRYGAAEKSAGRQLFSDFLTAVHDLVGVTASGDTAQLAQAHLTHRHVLSGGLTVGWWS